MLLMLLFNYSLTFTVMGFFDVMSSLSQLALTMNVINSFSFVLTWESATDIIATLMSNNV